MRSFVTVTYSEGKGKKKKQVFSEEHSIVVTPIEFVNFSRPVLPFVPGETRSFGFKLTAPPDIQNKANPGPRGQRRRLHPIESAAAEASSAAVRHSPAASPAAGGPAARGPFCGPPASATTSSTTTAASSGALIEAARTSS